MNEYQILFTIFLAIILLTFLIGETIESLIIKKRKHKRNQKRKGR